MKSVLFFVTVVWAVAIGARPAAAQTDLQPPANVSMRLFLLAGQSNMAGRGKVEPADTKPDPRVWMLDEAGHWQPAIDPLHFDKPDHDGVGPGHAFGLAVAAAEPGTVIGLIPTAVGGVSLDQWKPGGRLYTDAIRRVKIAQQHGVLKGILWHQGEADTKPAKIESYARRLDTLIAAFRRDLGVPDCPVVVGELGVFDREKNANRVPFNGMLDKYPTTRPNTALARSNGLASIGDNTHFNAASARELGRRYADAYLNLQRHPTTEPK